MTLIPRETLFGAPVAIAPSLSPDGRRFAYLERSDGGLVLRVGWRRRWRSTVPMFGGAEAGPSSYTWCYDSRHILFPRDESGDENWHVFSLDVETGQTRDLTPWPGVAAGVAALSPRHPTQILVLMNRRDPAVHDLWRVDVETGESREVFRNTGFMRFIVDDDFTVRLAQEALEDGAVRYLRLTAPGTWEPFLDIPAEDALTTVITGVTRDGRAVHALDSRGRDVARLVRFDLESGAMDVVAEEEGEDIVEVLVHPETFRLQGYVTHRLRRIWHSCDEETARDLQVLADTHGGDLHILSRTLDQAWWVVSHARETAATRFSLYDRQARRLEPLFSARPELDGLPLVPMQSLSLPTRDGLEMVSYLSTPPQPPILQGSPITEDTGGGAPWPLVLLVHGGPWGRVAWGYDAATQWLVNRGFAVLAVNFRGSVGFGKAFLNAGDREWGGAMQQDLIDAVDWAVSAGVADPRRLVVMGGSYGGYAVLRALTETPELFACGIALCPPVDLIGFLRNVPPYWSRMAEIFARRIGDHRSAEGRKMLKARSPSSHLDRISRPLFFAHGANDVRVSRDDADGLAAVLRTRGVPHLYALFENEGHVLVRPENIATFHALAEEFLSAVLKTPAQPFDLATVPPAVRLSGNMLGLDPGNP
ncbi:MAG: hypothetical protein VR70_09980 [Rhodospirillaceae bacterium BRH_c57]|nr:MAG: hypothetical protein VR70_09980 [Rhodospirillaceae bacterium BRH_c57]